MDDSGTRIRGQCTVITQAAQSPLRSCCNARSLPGKRWLFYTLRMNTPLVTWCPVLALLLMHGSIQAGTTGFTDQTAAAGLSDTASAITQITPILGGGTVADFNQDGWPDLYVTAGSNGPDMLYINNQDGSFSNASSSWGISDSDLSSAAVAADINGDGYPDLFVTSFGTPGTPSTGQHRLLLNASGNALVDATENSGIEFTATLHPDGWSSAWGDYDLDGDLDLAVAGYADPETGDRLFRNDGQGRFTDVTQSAGLDALTTTYGYTPRFADMDGDRYPELIWIGDYSTSVYLRNNRDGSFSDITSLTGTSLDNSEMGATVADYDNDGDFDLFVTTIGTNNLYINQGHHLFVNQADSAGVAVSGFSWGTTSVDVDHDGWTDLFVVSQLDNSHLFLNSANSSSIEFEDVSTAYGFTANDDGLGVSQLDYDNDGDQDLLIFPSGKPARLYRNDVDKTGTHWLKLRLHSGGSWAVAPQGIGAVIRCHTSQGVLTRRVDGGNNYMSQDDTTIHFGLGSDSTISRVTVAWPNGTETVLDNVAADQLLNITAPEYLFIGDFES